MYGLNLLTKMEKLHGVMRFSKKYVRLFGGEEKIYGRLYQNLYKDTFYASGA